MWSSSIVICHKNQKGTRATEFMEFGKKRKNHQSKLQRLVGPSKSGGAEPSGIARLVMNKGRFAITPGKQKVEFSSPPHNDKVE